MFEVENQVPKVVGIRRLTPLLSQSRLRFKAGSRGAKLLVEQLRDFPCGEFDDAPDALDVAFRLASEMLARRAEEELVALTEARPDRIPLLVTDQPVRFHRCDSLSVDPTDADQILFISIG